MGCRGVRAAQGSEFRVRGWAAGFSVSGPHTSSSGERGTAVAKPPGSPVCTIEPHEAGVSAELQQRGSPGRQRAVCRRRGLRCLPGTSARPSANQPHQRQDQTHVGELSLAVRREDPLLGSQVGRGGRLAGGGAGHGLLERLEPGDRRYGRTQLRGTPIVGVAGVSPARNGCRSRRFIRPYSRVWWGTRGRERRSPLPARASGASGRSKERTWDRGCREGVLRRLRRRPWPRSRA